MRWQIMRDGEPTNDPVFDDGVFDTRPGDEGFTTDLVRQHVATKGTLPPWGFNYVGPSWDPNA